MTRQEKNIALVAGAVGLGGLLWYAFSRTRKIPELLPTQINWEAA